MSNQYSIFRRFSNLELAVELTSILNTHGIEFIIDDNSPPVDVTFNVGSSLQDSVEVRIQQTDFEKAELILEHEAEKQLNTIDPNYYLFEFSNEELYDILLKADEWNKFDYTLAQKLLKDRGKPIDKVLLDSLKKQRIEDLSKPEGNQKPWIAAGYIFALLGGLLGLIIGYFLWTSKKTLPNGHKVHSYSQNDRTHGKYIFIISLLIFPISLAIRMII
ncbi:hypothetical protein [Psychroserpens damuponensis]|uniref:hypothetical protein n=1 Tax=Psychroserpens damuponensis TaxID=943936 RepID=UPI00058B6F63|nr:hypothetical protein [Psychroserpens damuponensis]